MFRDVPECSGMFRHVPACSGMFRVPGFIDGPPDTTPLKRVRLVRPRKRFIAKGYTDRCRP